MDYKYVERISGGLVLYAEKSEDCIQEACHLIRTLGTGLGYYEISTDMFRAKIIPTYIETWPDKLILRYR